MASSIRRHSVSQYDNSRLPHWYNKEDPEHIRTIFCELENLCNLKVDPNSRMIRQFVGSVFRRGVISFDPFIDFSILTICKDRTQGKEQDDFEHDANMALITWDEKEGLPREVEFIDSEPTVRFSFGRTVSAQPPVHPGSFVSSSGGERDGARSESPASVASPDAPSSPSNVSEGTTPREATTMKMMTKWYPELLCLPKYPRAKERDADYPPGSTISSARNKKRFVVHFRDSSEPSRVTYTYAAGMPAHSGLDDSSAQSNGSSIGGGSSAFGMSPPSGGPEEMADVVMFPKFTLPGGVTSTSTQDRSPWGPRPGEDDEDDDDDDDSSDGSGGGPPDVQWEEDDEWN